LKNHGIGARWPSFDINKFALPAMESKKQVRCSRRVNNKKIKGRLSQASEGLLTGLVFQK